jgi:Putative methyltransferase
VTYWASWHEEYEDPDSDIARRLRHVQRRLAEGLDNAPAGPIRLISLCAGEGRDVIGVLPTHPRRDDVTARLVELDPGIAATARAAAANAGLDRVEVVAGDAALLSAYQDLSPADIVLACGIFGNVDDEDIRRTIVGLRQLSKPGATVLWTRSRRTPDLTPAIRSWFSEAGFGEVAFDYEKDRGFSVGTQRFDLPPVAALALADVTVPFEPDTRLFEFRKRAEV